MVLAMVLNKLLSELRQFSGIRQKKQIATIANILAEAHPAFYPNGDDTAVISGAINGAKTYDLLATEGFLNSFVEQDPWFAGWCGLMVNISDIAAMGGTPVAVVNTLWGQDDERTKQIFEGMVAASKVYQVPVVGGHTNLNTPSTHLGVSILGKAKQLLSSFTAEPGQVLVCAVDLRGAYRKPFLNWNAASHSPPERLRGDLALLPYIAENGLAYAAKDISQASFLGTCLMLLESSNVGANVQLERIPKPCEVSWYDWLRSFPSYGFLMTTTKNKLPELLKTFRARDIVANDIGFITGDARLNVEYEKQAETFWDLKAEPLTSLSLANQQSVKYPVTNPI